MGTWSPNTGGATGGADTFTGTGTDNDVVDGLAGDDILVGNDGNDTLTGSDGVDYIYGDNGNDILTGGDGNDTLSGGTGDDTISGGLGNDTITDTYTTNGIVAVNGGDGDDYISIGFPFTSGLVEGGDGTDTLRAPGNITGLTIQNLEILDANFGGGTTATAAQFQSFSIILTGSNLILAAAATLDLTQQLLGRNGNVTGSTGDDVITTSDGADTINGGNGNDVLYGGAGTNFIDGGQGDDIVIAGVGNETLSGGSAGNDTVTYAAASAGVDVLVGGGAHDTGSMGINSVYADILIGSAHADTLANASGGLTARGGDGNDVISGFTTAYGENGDDTLIGSAGSDTLEGGVGDDVLDGAGGGSLADTASYANATAGVVVSLALTGAQDTIGAGLDTLSNLESLTGSAHNDQLEGNNTVNRIEGGAGDDIISGDRDTGTLGAQDNLFGGDGADQIDGGGGNDFIDGGAGDDIISLWGLESASIGGVFDTINGGANFDTLLINGLNPDAGAAQDWVTIAANLISNIERVAFGDTFTQSLTLRVNSGDLSANLNVVGSDAADFIEFVNSGVDLRAWTFSSWDASVDKIVIHHLGYSPSTLIYGSVMSDIIDTGGGQLNGWDGDDLIYSSTNNDTINGGNGIDTISYANVAALVTVNLSQFTAQNTGGGGTDTITQVENVTGSAFNDTLTGTSGANVIDGGVGADSMNGGDGDDTYVLDNVGDTITNSGGVDTVMSALSISLGPSVLENVTLTGATNANATGNAGANVLTGNTGANILTGGDGDDTLRGGAGNDKLVGGLGADIMNGGDGDDTFVFGSGDSIFDSGGIDTVETSVSITFTGLGLENVTLLGTSNLNATGNANANVMIGNSGANRLNGMGGADTMSGGNGNDTYVVDTSGDTTTEASSLGGIDLVQSSVGRSLGANLENLTLTGTGNVNGTGNTLANVVIGNGSANTLKGLGGGDTLNGGAGHDIMTGGTGADKFVFNAAAVAANSDTITDFTHNSDKLLLENAVFTALGAATGALAATKFWVGANAHDASDRIIYNAATGALFYDANGNGAGQKVLIATLDAGLTITATDFQVI